MALEAAVFATIRRPTAPELRDLHRGRVGKRATPVLIVLLWGDSKAAVCGPAGDEEVVALEADRSQIERICEAALDIPDRHSARRFLDQHLTQLDAPVPGLRNSGLFAMHELESGVPQRADWREAVRRAAPALGLRGHALLEGLGFVIKTLPEAQRASVLIARDTKVAIALFLERPDEIEPPSPRFDNNSPISFALAKADQENLDYVVVLAGSTLRVYPVKPQVGTARRGRTETFVELNLDLLREEQAGYLWLLCSAEALSGAAAFLDILAKSADYAADLGEQLRDRVYQEVVPQLAAALVKVRRLRNPSAERLRETYEMALLVLFRLLFVAYAEDKELLPLHTNKAYTSHSLKEIAKRLQAALEKDERFESEDFYWTEVGQLWKAIDKGNKGWGVPRYNGGLFASDEAAPRANSALAAITLKDADFAPALAALLLERTDEGNLGPIDFRSLGVREFGTIYEGLLESELSVAETDLAVDSKSLAYVPVKGRADVVVREGQVYLHNASGARKASGAYYTKSFAVEHLLSRALETALDDHFARLDACHEDRDAADRFFDFRVADIAMGSGHFLVAAVDNVERRFSNYLTKRRLPGVIDELARLRKTAQEELGEDWVGDPIEDTQLLRRQIARRCIFGVDLNPLAVELARLSVWIHTFVPGLPLSFLDQNLVQGNSLVGVATLDEAKEVLVGGSGDLFAASAEELLGSARKPLERLARLAEATAAEVQEARRLYAQMREAIRGEEMLLTVLAASRVDAEVAGAVGSANVATKFKGSGDLFSQAIGRQAAKALEGLDPLHFPIAFPQVFLGERQGFDVIVGNPPWDKVRFEEDAFFCRYIPGMNALPQAERKKAIAAFMRTHPAHVVNRNAAEERASELQRAFGKSSGAYKHQGSGHIDLAKLFVERIVGLLCPTGSLGIVLPRQCLVLGGWSELRRLVFTTRCTSVVQIRNAAGWIFPDAHHSYVIALLSGGPPVHGPEVRLHAGADDSASFRAIQGRQPIVWSITDFAREVSEELCIPLLTRDGEEELLVRLLQLQKAGAAEAGRYRMVPYSVIDVGKDLDAIGRDDNGLYVSRTRSVDAFGYMYDAEAHRVSRRGVEQFLSGKLADAQVLREAGFRSGGGPLDVLSLVYRYPSRNDDSRTLIASYLPRNACPAVGYVHSAVMPNSGLTERLCALGLLNSLVWDWVARRFVDRHVTAQIIRLLPLPRHLSGARELQFQALVLGLLKGPARERVVKEIQGSGHGASLEQGGDLLQRLDVFVAKLFDLTPADMELILKDFSEGSVSAERRQAILAGLRAGRGFTNARPD